MTPTVSGICTFAVFLSVSQPFCRFTLAFEEHFVLCYKEKLEPLDRAMANFQRSEVCMISAVIFVFCLLFEFGSLFWLISIARYVCKSPSICF